MPATAMHHQRDQDRKGSPSPSQTIRTQKSFKRRFAFDDGDEDAEIVQHRSPKRRDNKEFVPFDPFRRVRQDASVLYSAQSHDRYRRQQSPTPEPPLIRELEVRYSGLQIAMHSKIVSELEAAQEELTKEAVDAIKVNQVTLGNLSASYSGIVAPLLDAKTRKFMITPEGSEQHELVTMGVALDDFQKLVNTAETTLQNLWADWKEAKAEIEAVGREIDAPKEEVIDADSILIAQEHDAALAELNEDIDALTEKHIAEYKTYEKEFLRKIDNEAAKIVQSQY